MRLYRGRKIGVIFQDPMTSLDPLFTISDQLCETLGCLRPGCDKHAAALALLRDVGIPNAENRLHDFPHQFSGGMRQRVVIALALAGEPELLIADEPTTSLDVSVQSQILSLLRSQASNQKKGVLLISHDMGVIAQISDTIAVMRDGRVVESGPAKKLLRQPKSDYARLLFAAVPPTDRKLDRFVSFSGQNGEHDNLLDKRRRNILDTWPQAPPADPLLEVASIGKSFGGGWFAGGGEEAIKSASFRVASGESLGLVGESGSGKTTIARIVCGLTRPDRGDVRIDGQSVLGAKHSGKRRRAVQMIFQNPYSSLNPRMRVGRIIAEPMRLLDLPADGNERDRRVGNLLSLTGLPADISRRYPHEFSGGQRQRIAIARALASQPRLLICDEPTSSLDVSIQAQILNLLKDLQEELGLAMLFISHDLPVVRQMCDRIGVLRKGELLEIRPTEELFQSPRHAYTKMLLDLMPRYSPPDTQ